MFGGFGRPQPSSAEKIAAAEQEMDLVTDMFNKYIFYLCSLFTTPLILLLPAKYFLLTLATEFNKLA